MTPTLPRRTLGQGLQVSAVGLGCMGMSDFYGPADEATNLAVINRALDIGMNFLDTADMYGTGENEKLIAKVLRTRRSEVVIATKFAIMRGPGGEFLGMNGKPDYVRSACEGSLKRLGVDHIDLYYQHRVDPTVPIEDTVGAMAELVRQGKVRYLGLSEASAKTIRRAAAVHPIAALQTEYSLWTRDLEADILPACRELGIGIVPYSPLGRGFLTGEIRKPDDLAADDFRRTSPRFLPENFEANLALVERVKAIAKEQGCTPAQIALAWLLHRGPDVVPIPGTRSVKRLDENAGACSVKLGAAQIAALDRVLKEKPVAGERYPEATMKAIDR